MKVVVVLCWAVLSTSSTIVNRVVVTHITKGDLSEDIWVTIGWSEMFWRTQKLLEIFWEELSCVKEDWGCMKWPITVTVSIILVQSATFTFTDLWHDCILWEMTQSQGSYGLARKPQLFLNCPATLRSMWSSLTFRSKEYRWQHTYFPYPFPMRRYG